MGFRSRLDRRLVWRGEAKAGAQQAFLPPAAVRDSGRVYERRELCWYSLLFYLTAVVFNKIIAYTRKFIPGDTTLSRKIKVVLIFIFNTQEVLTCPD